MGIPSISIKGLSYTVMVDPRLSELSVPRTTVPAQIELAHGERHSGVLFLIPRAPQHSGGETPLEMLNRTEEVFPFRTDEGQILLIAKAQTLCVVVAQTDDVEDPDRLSTARAEGVEVALTNGAKFAGSVQIEMPETRARLLDFLNAAPSPFFAVASENETHYVNRNQVVFVRPLE